jgi:rRNA maturation protein Nop10
MDFYERGKGYGYWTVIHISKEEIMLARCMTMSETCICGKHFVILHPDKSEMVKKFLKVKGREFDIYIADGKSINCPRCGKKITLPIPEFMDFDRYPDGLQYLEMLKDVEEKIDAILVLQSNFDF